jgi:hypothetical protein
MMQERAITEVTRRDITDYISAEGVVWAGRLKEPDFLSRIWPLKEMPSDDQRFDDAAGDIWQHRVANNDWEDNWIFDDPRFDLRTGPDEMFVRFLSETLHPVVRPDAEDVARLLAVFNEYLARDRWEIVERSRISGKPVFEGRRSDDLPPPRSADELLRALTQATAHWEADERYGGDWDGTFRSFIRTRGLKPPLLGSADGEHIRPRLIDDLADRGHLRLLPATGTGLERKFVLTEAGRNEADSPLRAAQPHDVNSDVAHVPERDPELVAVAYGRDDAARLAVFQFLRAIGLQPLEWESLVAETHSAAPYSGEAVERGFAAAQAVVVLFTPDDVAQLHPDLANAPPVLQARPNVLLEAGMALATHPDRTLLVVIGDVELPTNLAGRNLIRLDGTPTGLVAMAARLEDAAKCPVRRRGSDWFEARSFAELAALRRAPLTRSESTIARGTASADAPALSVFLHRWEAGEQGHEQYVDVVASNMSGGPLTVVSMGLRMARATDRSQSWKVDDGSAKPALRALLQDGETVAMTWMHEELGRAFYEGEDVIVGCFALDGRGNEVVHTLPEPIGRAS